MPEDVEKTNIRLVEMHQTPPKAELDGVEKEVNAVAIQSLTTEPTQPQPLSVSLSPPNDTSAKTSIPAASIIGTPRARLESALLDAIFNVGRKSERAKEEERIEKAEERQDRRFARAIARDQEYFRQLAQELRAEFDEDEIVFDEMLDSIIQDETFFNKMGNLLSGRVEKELTGKADVTPKD